MRVVDLDRDMAHVIPTGSSPDSAYLFERMQRVALEATRPGPGRRILDTAAGLGQDSLALAQSGAWTVCAEPSQRMRALGLELSARADSQASRGTRGRDSGPLSRVNEPDPSAAASPGEAADPQPPGRVLWTRAWSESLPFAEASFDAVLCKGALDHFDDPSSCIREMARVTRPRGRVVLAVANYASLGCRLARASRSWSRNPEPGRPSYALPSDHFTRYDPELLREQATESLELEEWTGVSLLWGWRPWSSWLSGLSPRRSRSWLARADWLAGRWPAAADVIVLAGRPRAA